MSFEGFRITNGKTPKRSLAAAQFESDEDEQSQQLGAQPPLSSSRDNAGLEKVAADEPPVCPANSVASSPDPSTSRDMIL